MIRPCSEPGCGEEAVDHGRCSAHARSHWAADRGKHREVYATKRWLILRRRVLVEQEGLCVNHSTCGRLATEVDHIVPLADGGEPYRRSNVQGLCKPCHSAKTRQEV